MTVLRKLRNFDLITLSPFRYSRISKIGCPVEPVLHCAVQAGEPVHSFESKKKCSNSIFKSNNYCSTSGLSPVSNVQIMV
jgi:hypothetical protein